jgi:hypothetical protein
MNYRQLPVRVDQQPDAHADTNINPAYAGLF